MGSRLIVLGGSGHATVVVATARAAGFDVLGVFDDNPELHGHDVSGVPVIGPILAADTMGDVRAVVGIGSNAARRAVALRVPFAMATIVHPAATVVPDVAMGRGTVVFANATVQPRTSIGQHSIVNTGATIDHDCVVADFVHVAPGAILCGGVRVGAGVLIGAGATIVAGVEIGSGAVVGAGSVVLTDLVSDGFYVGAPARAIESP